MRILATWSRADVPDLSEDPDDAIAYGQIWGLPCRAAWATQWDRRPDWRPGPYDDLEWIGEDAQGVWCRYHPLALAHMQDPDFLSVLDHFYSSAAEGVSEDDWGTLSNWEFEIKLTAILAKQREHSRRMEKDPHVRDAKGQA